MVTHLGDVKFEAKVDSLAVTLAKVEVATGGDTLGDEEANLVLHNLAHIVAVVEVETRYTEQCKGRGGGRHGGCHPSSDGVTSHLAKHWAIYRPRLSCKGWLTR